VDAARFGGKTPDEWTETYDQRYVKRDDPGAAGEYRRYFKQLDKKLGDGSIEPAVIVHNLCRFPITEAYELDNIFHPDAVKKAGLKPEDLPPDWKTMKFLVYYATRRDPVAEMLRTESTDWFYWGDTLSFWLEQFGVQPARSQALDDLLNDFWGGMFNPGLEQDSFKGETFGHSIYVQRWIDTEKTVDDLVKGGQWDDLRVAVRPLLLSPGLNSSMVFQDKTPPKFADLNVIHLSQNAVEIRVPQPYDLMVLLRT
jgi:hypothetical protein